MHLHRPLLSAFTAFAFLTLIGCSNSDATGQGGNTSSAPTIVLNTTASAAYVTLGSPASAVTLSDPHSSTAWDLAFNPDVTVSVNGGASGPGSVRAYCICTNQSLSLTQVEALTAAQGASQFDAVTSANLPADQSFTTDTAASAVSGWFDYNSTTHAVTPSATVWGIRLASTVGAYAKLHVTAIPAPGMSNAGPITIQWAVQSSATGTLGADQQATLDLSSGAKVYVNLSTGAVSTTAPANWDIAFQGYTAFVNGGISGTGNVAAVVLVPSSFYTSYASITTIPVGATGIPPEAFTTDGAGGAFLASPPYRYDATTHQVYPTYDVYLVKRGSTVYKVQVTSYYNTAGVFGYVTLRYAPL